MIFLIRNGVVFIDFRVFMHILFLTDNFPPETNAPASRTFEHCREWVKAGHQVTIITCVPNFPKGKVFSGYKNKIWQTEINDGISVIRVWSYITANEGFVKRILDYLSFMFSASLASFFVRKVDIVIGTSPQFFTAVAAYFIGLVKRKPFVFELRDFWPESIKGLGLMGDSKMFRFLETVELFLYKKAAYIIPVTYSFKKELMSRGIDGNKIGVVTNGVDISRFSLRSKDAELITQHSLQNKFVIGYIGTHGMSQALGTLLKAAQLAKNIKGGASLHFLLLGNGAEKNKLMDLAVEMQLDNITFVDGVPKDEVARYWSILDVAVIHLRRIPLFTSIIPSKLFECMGMGIPVLHGVEGESADIVNKEGVGVTFTPECEVELLDSLSRLQNDPVLYQKFRDNSLLAAHKFDRTELAGKMLSMLKGI